MNETEELGGPFDLYPPRMFKELAEAKAALERERAAHARLRTALEDAIEGMEEMSCQVTEYFQEKHDHQGYIDRAKAALAAVEWEGRREAGF